MNQETKHTEVQKSDQNNGIGNGYDPATADEIDLADLIAVLYRKRWFVIIMTLLIVGAAFGYTFKLQKKYSISTMVEIGQVSDELGNYQAIESLDTVNNRLQSFGRIVYQKMTSMRSDATDKGLGFDFKKDFKIKIPKKGKIVSLNLETANTLLGADFTNQVIDTLIKAHDRIQTSAKNMIKRNIRNQQNKLVVLKHKKQSLLDNFDELDRTFKNKTITAKNNIAELYDNIRNIESQKKFQKQRIEYLESQKKELTEQIKDVEKRYNTLLDLKLKAGNQVKEEGALSLMLYSSEIQQNQAYLSKIRERLFFEIPEAISKIHTGIDKMDTDISKIRTKIKFQQQLISQLTPELTEAKNKLNRKIDTIKNDKQNIEANIEDLNQKMSNMAKTRKILEPQVSEETVSPNVKIIVALGCVSGFFISIFLAFILEFWAINRNKIVLSEK